MLILEKALAKFCGSYANIESGQVVWAFQATTGDAVAAYIQDSKGNWEHMKVTADEEHDHHKRAIQLYHTGNILNPDKMFKLLCKFERAQAVLCASSRGIDNTLNDGRGSFEGGIVAGHAYSIISAAEKRGQKLLRLRNPWGTFEFKGKRSDKDDAWVANPDVARAFGYKEDSDDNDGAFFIAWDDFCKFFDHIDVCLRTRGMSEFILEINEDFGGCGAAFGCLKGIFYFMCLYVHRSYSLHANQPPSLVCSVLAWPPMPGIFWPQMYRLMDYVVRRRVLFSGHLRLGEGACAPADALNQDVRARHRSTALCGVYSWSSRANRCRCHGCILTQLALWRIVGKRGI